MDSTTQTALRIGAVIGLVVGIALIVSGQALLGGVGAVLVIASIVGLMIMTGLYLGEDTSTAP